MPKNPIPYEIVLQILLDHPERYDVWVNEYGLHMVRILASGTAGTVASMTEAVNDDERFDDDEGWQI